MTILSRKYDELQRLIKEAGSVAVAFSGGVDSTLLLKTAVDVLGPEQVMALHASSKLQAADEDKEALSFIRSLGCKFKIYEVDQLSWPEFTANPPNRCYYCKKRLYEFFLGEIRDPKKTCLFDGTNVDDLVQDRPGLQAIHELRVATPLVVAALKKQEIRQLSKLLGLESWDKYSSSCLATRIPAGVPITGELVEVVRSGEEFLKKMGFYGCRVRIDRGNVYLELAAGDSLALVQEPVKTKISGFFREHGFKGIYLNLSERAGIVV